LPEKYFTSKKSSSHQFGRHVTSKKLLFVLIWAPLFSNQSMLGAIFAHIFKEF